MAAWAHLHLPRLRAGETPNVISLKRPGEKIDYVSWVELSNPTFRIHERGRQRALRDNVRNVHAWVVGEQVGSGTGAPLRTPTGMRKAVYDPWKGGTFVDAETLEPVFNAKRALLNGKDVFYE